MPRPKEKYLKAYRMVSRSTPEELEQAVMDLAKEGFKEHGTPFTLNGRIIQAMIKKEVAQ